MISSYFKRLKTEHVCIILLSVLISSVIILSCVPPVSRDALVYHLALPKLYLKYGEICEIPSLIFSYFPSNLHLLYTIPLYFNNDSIPKIIHFAFAMLTAWLIFVYLRKRLSTLYGLFGALFFLSIPLIVKLSITAYVDLGLVFFSTASLFYLIRWIEDNFKLKHLILSGIWCGLALGTKYNGLMVLFLMTLFVPFVYSRSAGPDPQNQYKAIAYSAVFMLTALLIFSPWMIRNYIWTHNPIYPLYDNWFNPDNPAPAYSILTIMNFELRSIIQEEPWWEIALLPIRIFFQGQDGNPRYFDGKLNPFLLFLPFFAFWQHHKASSALITEKKMFAFFSILVLLFVLFTTNMCQLRYTAIMIPPLVILAVFGLHDMHAGLSKFPQIRKTLMVVIAISAAGINAAYIYGQFKYVDPISYITGSISRDEYIKRYRGEYPALQFANSNLPENAKILGIFIGDRRYYCDKEMVFDINGLLKTIKEAASPEKIASDLGKKGITHLLIRYDLFNEWRGNNFEGGKAAMLGVFLRKHLTPLFSKGGYGLFRLEKNS